MRSLISERGFTLLELLVAISILSVIAVIVGGSLGLGVRAWERGESDIGDSQRMRIFTEMLTQQLKSAYPYEISVDNERVVAFRGESDSIWFVTSSTNISEGSLKWISYFTEGGALKVKEGFLPDKDVLEKISAEEGEVLDAEVSGIKLEYLSPDDEEWLDSWDLDKLLPKAVRVRMDPLPEFVVYVPAGQRAGNIGAPREAMP